VTRDGFRSVIGCVGATVLLAACGHGGPSTTSTNVVNSQTTSTSSAPSTSSASASTTSASAPTSSASVTTTSEIATATTAQPAALAPFVGTWMKHEEKLGIDGAGTGHWLYADVRLCPTCASATAPPGTLDFTLASVSNGVASGSVTASSDPHSGAVGDRVTAKIVPGYQGNGVNLQLTIGASTAEVFCNNTSPGQCGA
jgi:cytoskeletal protein RodZ